MGPSDTHPNAERVQIELLRRESPAQHFAVTRALSETAMWHAWRVIAENNPGASHDELTLRFVATYYGQHLADKLRPFVYARRGT